MIEILEIVLLGSYRQDRIKNEIENELFANLVKSTFIIQPTFIQLCLYLGIKSGEFQRHGQAD